MIDKLLDALKDVVKLLPFLFVSFLLMEFLEHKINNRNKLSDTNKYGPFLGAFLGIIPQCGFSALAANLYAVKVISLGTLVAIFLSTSDEMVPILLANKTNSTMVVKILLMKFLIGLLFGIIIDLVYRRKKGNKISEMCHDDNCHCSSGIFKSSLIHTLKIAFFILIVNIILNIIIDKDVIINFVNSNEILTPIITSLLGLIPNCVSSVVITELYLSGVLSLGSMMSGVLSGSGVGILILFKQNKNIKENLLILLLLVIIASCVGITINLI